MNAGDYHDVRGHSTSRAYERGWSEGWNAALAQVQAVGLERVLDPEKRIDGSGQLRLADGDGRR